jgi:hypothetical protein
MNPTDGPTAATPPLPEPEETIALRPRVVRIASYAIGSLVLLAAVITGILSKNGAVDLVGFTAFGLAVFWFCHREASVRVIAAPDHVVIRNLFVSRQLEWTEVVGVTFTPGEPWAKVDLTDGETLSVMAVQRTVGERGRQDAVLLARLVAQRGEPHGD